MMSALWLGVFISLGTWNISSNASPVSTCLTDPFTDTVAGRSARKGSDLCDVTPPTAVSEISWQMTSKRMVARLLDITKIQLVCFPGNRKPITSVLLLMEASRILNPSRESHDSSSETLNSRLEAFKGFSNTVEREVVHSGPLRSQKNVLSFLEEGTVIGMFLLGKLFLSLTTSHYQYMLNAGRKSSLFTAAVLCLIALCVGNHKAWAAREVAIDSSLFIKQRTGGDFATEQQVASSLLSLADYVSPKCHLFLVMPRRTRLFEFFLRFSGSDKKGVRSVVALNLEDGRNMTGISDILERMIGDSQCWSLLLDLTNDADNVLRFVGKSNLHFWPSVRVFVVGSKGNVKVLLRNASLRNALRTYYLSLDERTITSFRSLSSGSRADNSSTPVSDFATKLARNRVDFKDGVVDGRAEIHFRCIYCEKGNPGVKKLLRWNLEETLGPVPDFPDETKNFNGHQLNIVCKKRIPLTDVDRNWGGPAGTVGPLDSLDVRINNAVSRKLNFTYLLREPWDDEWGLLGPGGNFTGVVGTLQYEKADFSFMLTATPGRSRVMDYSRVYAGDPFVIVSLKPQALPRYLAIVRPFTIWVWSSVLISCLFAGVVLWLIEKIRWSFSGAKAMSLTNSLLDTVRMILINPPEILPTHLASQFLFGIWSVASLVIVIGYQSALIAHLTVDIRSSAINTFEDLYKMKGQKWGWIEYTGTAIAYLAENPDPIVQEIYKKLEIHSLGKQMDLILAGHYSHVTRKTIVWVDFLKAERRGLPVHMSTTEYPVFGGYGWGFRKGAPFRDAIDKMKQRLIEAGLIDRWLSEVIKVQVEASERKEFNGSLIARQANEKEQRALSLENLQGAFYLLFIGYWTAVLVLLLEIARWYYAI